MTLVSSSTEIKRLGMLNLLKYDTVHYGSSTQYKCQIVLHTSIFYILRQSTITTIRRVIRLGEVVTE